MNHKNTFYNNLIKNRSSKNNEFYKKIIYSNSKKNKINLDSHFYNFMLSQNSKDTIKFLNGDYKITDNVR